jgi:peptide/nickel transport system permease protein
MERFNMIGQIVRAVLSKVVTFFLVTVLMFITIYSLPTDTRLALYTRAFYERPPYTREQISSAWGFYDPVFDQYRDWLFGHLLIWPAKGDSPEHTSMMDGVLSGNGIWSKIASDYVLAVVGHRLPRTGVLLLLMIPFLFAGIWLGVWSALRHGKLFDRVIFLIARLLSTWPVLVLGLFVMALWGASLQRQIAQLWELRPLDTDVIRNFTGITPLDALLNGRTDIFPVATLYLFLVVCVIASFVGSMLIKITRSAALEAWWSKEVLIARAGGLPEKFIARQIIWPQVWRSIAASSGKVIFVLIDAIIIVETVFNYPGLGTLIAYAAIYLDAYTLIGLMLYSAMAILLVKLLVEVGQIVWRSRRTTRRVKPVGFH